MKYGSFILGSLLLNSATVSALSLPIRSDDAFSGAPDLTGFEHYLLPRDGAPVFNTFEEYQNFANTASGTEKLEQPYTFSKKCSSAPRPDMCTSCAAGTNALLASGVFICGIKYGPAVPNQPLQQTPRLAACLSVAVGLWFSNMVGCVTK